MAGLYLHVPFCASKCAYCDFVSVVGREEDFAPVFSHMIEEMLAHRGMIFDTVFIGGGTPSVLPAGMLAALCDAVKTHFTLQKGYEWTCEANPGSLTAEKLEALLAGGVNRLSLGAQSADPTVLSTLGRRHTWADVVEAVAMARQAGIRNLNIDLIYGVPGQAMGDWQRTVEAALALAPEHLSLYSLILEEHTPLYERVHRRVVENPDPDLAADMADWALLRLQQAGYPRYEVSNYAHTGYECRHNIGYWLRRDYLGIGCAAHSLLDSVRYENPPTLAGYLAGDAPISTQLTPEEILFERVMLGLRMVDGIPLDDALMTVYAQRIPALQAEGLLEKLPAQLRLTERGMDLQNAVLQRFLS